MKRGGAEEEKRMTKGKKFVALLTAVVVCICTAPLLATTDPTYISGTSTATLITDGGVHDGWYLYEIEIDWDLNTMGAGLSHWDIILKPGCGSLDHLIGLDTPAGYSTCENYDEMWWSGYFQRGGDDSVPEILDPIVKYNDPFIPSDAQPGPEGYGTFSFYANIIPENGTYENALMAKGGTIDPVYGDLTGDYPSCTIIPEPATILLLGLGGLALLRKRRN